MLVLIMGGRVVLALILACKYLQILELPPRHYLPVQVIVIFTLKIYPLKSLSNCYKNVTIFLSQNVFCVIFLTCVKMPHVKKLYENLIFRFS